MIDDVAIALHHHAAFRLQPGFDAFVLNAVDGGREAVPLHLVTCLELALVTERKGEGLLPAGLYPDDDDVVGHRGEGGLPVIDTAFAVGDVGGGGVEVKVAPVVGDGAFVVEIHEHAAECQVFHAVGTGDEMLVDELGGFFLVSGKDGVAHGL